MSIKTNPCHPLLPVSVHIFRGEETTASSTEECERKPYSVETKPIILGLTCVHIPITSRIAIDEGKKANLLVGGMSLNGEGGPAVNGEDPTVSSTNHEHGGQSNDLNVGVEAINGDAYFFDKLDMGSEPGQTWERWGAVVAIFCMFE
ncbi:hypothetical protein RIF29_00565 [Crotalaria pallida]|uniref:Uncharacterized protein n=1 Tax=Crotalaria pallida TaxID=3830 RepID=A0AAN9IVQ3_CROPI